MNLKGMLKAVTLELRHELEGDLERRLASIGIRRDRAAMPVDELPHLPPEDVEARRVVDVFLRSRSEAGLPREASIGEFVRESAYTWANRLLALRCMEARGLLDDVILQKEAYGGRSLQHHRLARKQPERCSGEDEGLYAVLSDEFERRAQELPLLFNPRAPEVALRPSVAALKRCIGLLSGTVTPKGQEATTDEVFTAPDTLGWTYQYWNAEEKDQVFEKVRTRKGAKIEGAEIIPATCIYTEPYIVKFLVQNSLGAIWRGMYPSSRLTEAWEYYVHGADLPAAAAQAGLPAPRPEAFFVYAIECEDGSIYIGQTDNWPRRWEEHLRGRVDWTSKHKPLRIAHYEEFPSREMAVKREADLKTGFGRQWLKDAIRSGRARQAGRTPVAKRPVREITFLDPACGSGHFLIETFDLFYAMYREEGEIKDPAEICAAILENNLYGIDIDERAVQIAALALFMKAKEKAPDFVPRRVNLVATNIHLTPGKNQLDAFLHKHPEDTPLKPALLSILEGLSHVDELGSLLQIEQPVDKELRYLKEQYEQAKSRPEQHHLWAELAKPVQGRLPVGVEDYPSWKRRTLARLHDHFEEEAGGADLGAAFFGDAAGRGVSLVDLLACRYDVVAANPPYMGSKNMGEILKRHVQRYYPSGKRDLYAAFILRCLQLAADGGRVAMVTQQSWMFLRSFADLRALDLPAPQPQARQAGEAKLKKTSRAFTGVLRETSIEALAHLGEHAFEDPAAAGAFVALFVLARSMPASEHRLTAFRLVGPKSPEEKDAILREAISVLASRRDTTEEVHA